MPISPPEAARSRFFLTKARNCASCANYTARKDLDDHLARACGETYRGICRLPGEPVQGAFIRKVRYHVNCRDWRAERDLLAA